MAGSVIILLAEERRDEGLLCVGRSSIFRKQPGPSSGFAVVVYSGGEVPTDCVVRNNHAMATEPERAFRRVAIKFAFV